MKTQILNPKKALNKAFLKLKPNRAGIETFKQYLIQLLDRINDTESEEFHKNLIIDFLKKTYYEPDRFINTKGRNDLVIHSGDKSSDPVSVIIETKKPGNRSEMISREMLNAKAFHELILYYLRERHTSKNLEIKHLIATNINEWFIFDANVFEKLFASDKELVHKFEEFEQGRLSGTTTDFFYKEIAAPFIDAIKEEIEFTYFDIRDYEAPLRNNNPQDDNKLIALYKLLSPEHLLKLPFSNDSNSLDKRFYGELLHILGLSEVKQGSKKLIERNKEGERHAGSLLESAINQLDIHDSLSRLKDPASFGVNRAERQFNAALELCITWINRILFLKLLEAQLLAYHKGDKSYKFLNLERISSFDDLDALFFQVLARTHDERSDDIKKAYAKVPYLNSSLFEPTEIEYSTIFISNLNDGRTIPLYGASVLKDESGKKRSGKIHTLEYLFAFLDAYDFSSEGSEEIQEDNKTLINASVLGLIFEKINGYKDGSFFTPGFITMYMCRETIRKAVIRKFNEAAAEKDKAQSPPINERFATLDDIYNQIDDDRLFSRNEANEIINSLKICDPAVGSGHFLVSALNEIIAIKSELHILQDENGRRLKNYHIAVENDELIVTDEEGELFEYNYKNAESSRVQKTLFHEKQTIIENCLFGVDINANSVKICRLRLWIELLKNTYYLTDDSSSKHARLETLPNIDINIKCGNSLISRFDIEADLSKALKESKWNIDSYRIAVATYRNARNKEEKRDMVRLIDDIKGNFRSEIAANDPLVKKLYKKQGELTVLTTQDSLFAMSAAEKKKWQKDVDRLTTETAKLEAQIEEIKNNKIYENAFEWRFEFPEVLNNNGDFTGFDVVIGNPPYIKEYEGKEIFDGLRNNEIYQGKMDIWYMFASDGIKLLTQNGVLNYIAPNNWVTNAGAAKFRDFILRNSKIIELVDFGSFMVFDSASIQTMIMRFQKTRTNNYNFHYRKIIDEKPNIDDVINLLQGILNDKNEYLNPEIIIETYLGKNLTFSNDKKQGVLDILLQKSNFQLTKNEVANGIHPHHDFVNKKIGEKLGGKFKVGTGIFALSNEEKEKLNLTKKENELIKPYFTSDQFFRYYAISQNKYWLIYTSSKFKNAKEILPYPNIKEHLDQFQSVITSDNRPYGLHRTRVEDFFIGEKIIVQRKCPLRPIFTYSDFDTYVSATFYVIKTDRVDQKYLTALLNSKLIEFWLKHKGKMQGNNYQIDKEPLINLPLINPLVKKQDELADLVSKIISRKQSDPKADTSALEAEIDRLVYELYGLTEEEITIVEKSVG